MVVEEIRAAALANVFKEPEIWPDLRPIREKFQRETVGLARGMLAGGAWH
jgi:hypothetical protein